MKHAALRIGAVLASAFLLAACRDSGPAGKAEGIVGGIGLARITVYDQRPGPDGLFSGAPYMRAVTDEGFYVMSGTGRLEIHDVRKGFRSINLSPGRYVQVPPCTLLRLVGTDHLVVLSLRAGPGKEAGEEDVRLYFGQVADENPAEYERLAGGAGAEGLEGALKRRDEAVRAYGSFFSLWSFDRVAYYKELERFVGHVLNAAAAGRTQLGDGTAGSGWTARHRARLKDLPLNRDEIPAVFSFPPEKESLGWSGLVLRVTSLDAVK